MNTYISEEILDLLIGFEYLLESQSGEKFDIKHIIKILWYNRYVKGSSENF